MPTVRRAAVAGRFYPGRRDDLERTVDGLLAEAREHVDTTLPAPKALLLPHAGYLYSGSTAALGYAALAPGRRTVTRVVLLGPAHRVALDGVAESGWDRFATPLGDVVVEPVAGEVRQRIAPLVASVKVHEEEHSLEVHLPFLQRVLPDARVVPLAVGRAAPDLVAGLLDALWGGPETVVIVSSDLSHDLPYAHGRALDAGTVDQILRLWPPVRPAQACGATATNGLIVAARQHGLQPRLLGLHSSGDTAGDKKRVVGYAAIRFDEHDIGVRSG